MIRKSQIIQKFKMYTKIIHLYRSPSFIQKSYMYTGILQLCRNLAKPSYMIGTDPGNKSSVRAQKGMDLERDSMGGAFASIRKGESSASRQRCPRHKYGKSHGKYPPQKKKMTSCV